MNLTDEERIKYYKPDRKSSSAELFSQLSSLQIVKFMKKNLERADENFTVLFISIFYHLLTFMNNALTSERHSMSNIQQKLVQDMRASMKEIESVYYTIVNMADSTDSKLMQLKQVVGQKLANLRVILKT